MRVAHVAVRALLGAALGAILVTATQAPATADDDLTVTTDGVSFDGRQVEREGRHQQVGYSIRSAEGWRYAWLTEPLRGSSGYVAFSSATAEMPDGYCVTYVRVPGVGEWHESSGNRRCTEPAAAPTTAAPSAEPSTSPSARPSKAAATPEPSAEPSDEPEEPTDEPEAAASSPGPSASPDPSPSPSPTPTPTASPSPTPSPTPSPSHSAVAAAEAMRAEQFEALRRSFRNDLPVIDEQLAASRSDRVSDGELWAASGLGLAVVGLTAGGIVVWRTRRGPE
ncbi:hypothetical protein GCM10009718_10940 [Isoptericola halotolerans]|uniref:Uncharacterized protein n=1 Tax=Isoptericola halotolerans TaxID=300560 RepID=A0ABX1ZZD9_9MICO|nr:hypothetical protein [Isoptericola halotolerans]NOV95984.1 hypothetical protein [Isoptericola halotolerans]